MDYLKSVMSRRRCSDPLPQLVSLSPLSDPDNTSTRFIAAPDITETPKQKLNSGLSTWSKKVGQKWSKLKRNNSSELLTATSGRRRHWSPTRIETTKSSKKVSRAASIRNISSNDNEFDYNCNKFSSSESIPYDYKKLYEIYKDTLVKRTEEKATRGRRKIKSLNGSLRLSEKQFLDYLLLIKPNSQEDIQSIISDLLDQDVKCSRIQMESLSESKSCNPKQTRKFRVVRNIFSKLSSKSDDEDDVYVKKKSVSSNSLPSLSEFLNSSKKAISLTEISNFLTSKPKNTIKCDESGYGSDSTRMDSPRESIKSQLRGGLLGNDSSAIIFPSRTEDFMDLSFTFPSNNSCDGNLSIKEETYANSLRKECRSKFRLLEYSKRRRSESSETAESRSKRLNQNISPRKHKIDITDIDELCRTLNEKLSPKNEIAAVAYPSTTLQTNHNYSTLGSKIDYEYKCVRLRLETTDFIGIKIGTKNDTERYIVTDIVPESIAERNGNLRIGDEIIKVNGTRLRGVPFTFATSLLVPERNELEIIISREVICKTENSPKINQEKPTYNPFLSSTTKKNLEEKNDKIRMDVNQIYEQPSTIYHISSPDSKYSTLENKRIKSNTSKVQSIPLTGMRKFSYTQDHLGTPIYPQNYTTVSDSSSMHVVNFKKGPGMKSLGFSIVGGRDTPKRPMDLYVKTIFEEGQAAESGVLKEGDKLISINGKCFEGLTHKEAIILFKSIKFGEIVLKIERLNHKSC